MRTFVRRALQTALVSGGLIAAGAVAAQAETPEPEPSGLSIDVSVALGDTSLIDLPIHIPLDLSGLGEIDSAPDVPVVDVGAEVAVDAAAPVAVESAQPVAVDPVTTAPAAVESGVTEAVVAEPIAAEPVIAEPVASQPAATGTDTSLDLDGVLDRPLIEAPVSVPVHVSDVTVDLGQGSGLDLGTIDAEPTVDLAVGATEGEPLISAPVDIPVEISGLNLSLSGLTDSVSTTPTQQTPMATSGLLGFGDPAVDPSANATNTLDLEVPLVEDLLDIDLNAVLDRLLQLDLNGVLEQLHLSELLGSLLGTDGSGLLSDLLGGLLSGGITGVTPTA